MLTYSCQASPKSKSPLASRRSQATSWRPPPPHPRTPPPYCVTYWPNHSPRNTLNLTTCKQPLFIVCYSLSWRTRDESTTISISWCVGKVITESAPSGPANRLLATLLLLYFVKFRIHNVSSQIYVLDYIKELAAMSFSLFRWSKPCPQQSFENVLHSIVLVFINVIETTVYKWMVHYILSLSRYLGSDRTNQS